MLKLVSGIILTTLVLFSGSLYAQSQENEVLLTVGKESVTAREFMYLYRKNHIGGAADYTEAKVKEYLDLFTAFKLKVLEARTRGTDTTKEFRREFQQYRDELRKPYLPDKRLSDSLLELTYNRMKEEVRAAHILIGIATEADTLTPYNKIMQIRDEILKGLDFTAAAHKYSEDPSAKENGGDLGYFTALQMVYPFETAAFSTPVGSVSMPIRTRFGYHLVKVVGRQPSRGEVEVAHILIRSTPVRSEEAAKKLVFEVVEQLQGGVKWDEVCKEFSEDQGSKDQAGYLKPFGTGVMSGLPEFERQAFELKPGEISDPFKTSLGWHILKVVRKIPLPPMEQMATSLRNKVNRDDRTQISKVKSRQKLRTRFHYKSDESVRNKVYGLADTTLVKSTWNPVVPENLLQSSLFTIRDKSYSVQQFLAFVRQNARKSGAKPVVYLDQLYQQFVDESVLENLEAEVIATNPDFGYLLKEYYEGILLFGIMEQEVWTKASQDSLGQVAYFKKNRKSYPGGLRAEGTIYSAKKEADLKTLETLLKSGTAEEIRKHLSEFKIKAESGYFEPKSREFLGRITWNEGMYLQEDNGMYYLAWLKRIIPPGLKEFGEVRPQLVSDYQGFLEKKWVASLRKKYPLKVNDKIRKYCFEQLVKK